MKRIEASQEEEERKAGGTHILPVTSAHQAGGGVEGGGGHGGSGNGRDDNRAGNNPSRSPDRRFQQQQRPQQQLQQPQQPLQPLQPHTQHQQPHQPHLQQWRGGRHHQHHFNGAGWRGGQSPTCVRCGRIGHYLTECRAVVIRPSNTPSPATTPTHHAAPPPEPHVVISSPHPAPLATSYYASAGRSSPPASFTSVPPSQTPYPPAPREQTTPPSDSAWYSSSRHSPAYGAHFVPPSVPHSISARGAHRSVSAFGVPPSVSVSSVPPSSPASSVPPSASVAINSVPPSTPVSRVTPTTRRTPHASGIFLPTAFAFQPVAGTDQAGDVWVAGSGASCHMTKSAELMYDTRAPAPEQTRVILGNGTTTRVEFVGKIDVVFHSTTDFRVTLQDVSFVPGLRFNLVSLLKVQCTHAVVLDRTGTHIELLCGRLTFPRREGGSYLRATRVTPGQTARSVALAQNSQDSSSPPPGVSSSPPPTAAVFTPQ